MGHPPFGTWLKRQRQALDLTQEKLARLVPCAPETIRKLEVGTRRPSRAMAERLALLLAVPVEDLDTFVQLGRAYSPPPRYTNKATAVPKSLAGVPPQSPFHLPAPVTSLIGRVQETARVWDLLRRDDVRLVTLTGPPGVGKTRLALHTAAQLYPHFQHGVVFVPLAPLSNPSLLLSTIAQSLGLRELRGQPLLPRLQALLADRQLLLVLDNFEHLLPAAPLASALMASAPHLNVLVTSRAVLQLYGEHLVEVPPLALPDLQPLPALDQLAHYDAVRLFTTRAQAVQPDFTLNQANARAVAEVCVRLEGLPLAIELAAARCKHFSPGVLHSQLTRRLVVLTDGPRDLPARQRTLRDAIAWSYALLPADEQLFFRRLGVFVGGCSLEASAMVCLQEGAEQQETFSLLAALVNQSLVQQHESADGSLRFTTLETIREYALEQLEESGEAAWLRDQHLGYFLGLAEEAERQMHRPTQRLWLERLQQEHGNLRAALAWAQQHDPEQALSLAGALLNFWVRCGHLVEGRKWLECLLAHTSYLCNAARAKALSAASVLAWAQGEYVQAETLAEAALGVWQALGDPHRIANTYNVLGLIIKEQGDYTRARPLLEHSLQLARAQGNNLIIAAVLGNLGDMFRLQGDYQRAKRTIEESCTLFRGQGERLFLAVNLTTLGWVAHQQAEYATAREHYRESVLLCRQVGSDWGLPDALEGMAGVAAVQGDAHRAARLFGAAERLRNVIGAAPWASECERNDRCMTISRTCLGETTYAAEWAAGQAMTLEQAVAYALEECPPPTG